MITDWRTKSCRKKKAVLHTSGWVADDCRNSPPIPADEWRLQELPTNSGWRVTTAWTPHAPIHLLTSEVLEHSFMQKCTCGILKWHPLVLATRSPIHPAREESVNLRNLVKLLIETEGLLVEPVTNKDGRTVAGGVGSWSAEAGDAAGHVIDPHGWRYFLCNDQDHHYRLGNPDCSLISEIYITCFIWQMCMNHHAPVMVRAWTNMLPSWNVIGWRLQELPTNSKFCTQSLDRTYWPDTKKLEYPHKIEETLDHSPRMPQTTRGMFDNFSIWCPIELAHVPSCNEARIRIGFSCSAATLALCVEAGHGYLLSRRASTCSVGTYSDQI